jgi:hypothetical protein
LWGWCGAGDFAASGGRGLRHTRFHGIASLCHLKLGGYAVELGCGRGELASYLTANGFRVRAIDSAPEALRIARSLYPSGDPRRMRVEFACEDARTFVAEQPIDLALACDLMPFVSIEDATAIIARVALQLAADGLFIVYAGSRSNAISMARTDAQRALYLTDLSEESLENQLRTSFAHTLVLVGDDRSPARSLLPPTDDVGSDQALIGIASHQPIDIRELLPAVASVACVDPGTVSLAITEAPRAIRRDSLPFVTVELSNASATTLSSFGPFPFHLSYHWFTASGELLVESGRRTRMWPPLPPGRSMSYDVEIEPPNVDGTHRLVLTVVQEFVTWFDWHPGGAKAERMVDVVPWVTNADPLAVYEHRQYSQNGEDGMLKELFTRIGITDKLVAEIGVEDGRESNAATLVTQYGWSALLIEGDTRLYPKLAARYAGIERVRTACRFVTRENVIDIFASHGIPTSFDCLSIDVDGNDYWFWRELARQYCPRVVVIEFNPSLSPPTDIVFPYDPAHRWNGNTEFGASLVALVRLGGDLGYAFAGVEPRGINAFFVRSDLFAKSGLRSTTAAEAYARIRGWGLALT